MANEPTTLNTVTATPTPAPVVDNSLAIQAAPVAPVVEAALVTPTPVLTETPPQSPEATPKVETLLAEGLDKPATVETPEVNKDSQEGQSVDPASPVETVVPEVVPPKYEPFTLPEGISLDNDRVGKFTELLSGLELEGKASHDVVQQFGQKAVDMYLNEVKNYGENLTKYYQTTWDKQKTAWKDATLKDPEIGGNRIQTTLDSVLGFIRTHGGTAEQQKEFRDVMETSGLGNHPSVIRLFANAALAYKEGKPLAAPKPIQETKSKTETMYGRKS